MNRKDRRAAIKRGHTPDGDRPRSASISDLTAEADRHYNQGRLAQARDICQHILARDPSHLRSLNLLGIVAQAAGDHRLAVKMLKKAVALDELNAACHFNLASSYQILDRRAEAVAHFRTAIALGMNNTTVEKFIVQSPVIAALLGRIAKKWPLSIKNDELFGAPGVVPVAADLFLLCALETVTVEGVALEVMLTHVRSALLDLAMATVPDFRKVDDNVIGLSCALAQQCFINEYVYALSDQERRLANQLRDLLLEYLKSGNDIAPFLLAVVAAYFPLRSLALAESLLSKDWHEAAAALLRQQLGEPLEEERDRHLIPALTAIEDSASLQVMRQYEENPYPRWTINPLAVFAADQADGKTIDSGEQRDKSQILIAGCGTGKHAVQIAQVFPNARVLAVDISLASLGYARRKSRELGLSNIEYAQADILQLATSGRSFDHIEAVGVLHHLADPMIGWRALLSLLRPNADMRIGLYSETARQAVVEARAFIAERGYRANADDIRRCRQDIIRDRDDRRWETLIHARDFYSMSGCRDLLFNVIEHRFSIPEIGAFLSEHGLSFLGFEFSDDASVIERFQRQFPGPSALTNLDYWHVFETTNPQTFCGMYVFLVRKNQK
jgi:2-polyprenyl-3-methyl-5-hydroxy-6-metoxy-1,4-benzoquinol methylase